MRKTDFYVVSIKVDGVVLQSCPMRLSDAERIQSRIIQTAVFLPQVVYDSTRGE